MVILFDNIIIGWFILAKVRNDSIIHSLARMDIVGIELLEPQGIRGIAIS